jgi:protein-S-isoprenylcysteine O-methyltransferase Ste14
MMSARVALENAVFGLWVAWLLYWWIAARNVKVTRRREGMPSRLAHIVPLALAAWMLAAPRLPGGVLGGRFLPATLSVYLVGVLVLAAGLAFTVWARVILGRNWSGTVTLKEGHELIRSGPYRFVRHPIYTGLLVAFAGSAIARGEWRGLVALAIAFAALWRKLKLEERWLGETFGDAYERYRAEVPALIPFLL